MNIKVGQVYMGKMSGDKRRVVGETETKDYYILQNCDNPEYVSKWHKDELEKCCTLVKEDQP